MQSSCIINQKIMLDVLTSMQPICNRRTTLEVTESILFELTPRELTLKATDLEISLQSTVPIQSMDTQSTSFLVVGKRIFELVKELEGEIAFAFTKNQLHLKAADVHLALNVKNIDDFPSFPERIENLMEMDARFLLTLLNKVAFVIPQNNAQSALNGMLIEFEASTMSFVATDGHCLAKVRSNKYTLPENKKWLLPKRAISELKKILEVSEAESVFLGTCGNQLVFSGANFNFFTKLIAEQFPAYQAALDRQDFRPAAITKSNFIKTLKRTNCLLAGQFISTNFTFEPSKVDVTLHNKEVGRLEESLALSTFTGASITSHFYSPYLLHGLQVFPDETVHFYIKNEKRPIIFEAEQKDYHFTYLVMPVSAQKHTE